MSSKSDKILIGLLFTLIFFGFYFVFVSFDSPLEDEGTSITDWDRQINESINQSLKKVYYKSQIMNLKIKTTHEKLPKNFNKKMKHWVPSEKYLEIYDVDMSPSEVDLSSVSSVEDQLRNKREATRQQRQQRPLSRKEYIRKFKENARKDGWIVELNNNLKIISVKKM